VLEWTGERFVPWVDDPFLASEHIHRYVFARSLASGRRVVDLASGEGYGSAMLAAVAARVVGLDIAGEAVRHAQEKYASDRLLFVRGSIATLPFADASFDLVTCFEALEHIEAQEALVSEVARILAPGGQFLVSTPDRDVYRDAHGDSNPFHCRELDRAEFEALLRSVFPHVCLLGQAVVSGSRLSPLGARPAPPTVYAVNRSEGVYRVEEATAPAARYLVAVASSQPLPSEVAPSFLVDGDGAVMAVVQEMSLRLRSVEAQFAALETAHRDLERAYREIEGAYGELQGTLERLQNQGAFERIFRAIGRRAFGPGRKQQ
jgi:SAM-dependent methyltransferase